MRQVKVIGKLLSPEKTIKFNADGFFDNNVLKYVDDNVNVEFDLENDILIRKNEDYEIKFNFKKDEATKNTLKLVDMKEIIQLNLYTIDLVKTEDSYYVRYELNDDELFEFQIDYK